MTDPEHVRYHASLEHLRYAVAVAAQVVGADAGARAWIARHPDAFGRLVVRETESQDREN